MRFCNVPLGFGVSLLFLSTFYTLSGAASNSIILTSDGEPAEKGPFHLPSVSNEHGRLFDHHENLYMKDIDPKDENLDRSNSKHKHRRIHLRTEEHGVNPDVSGDVYNSGQVKSSLLAQENVDKADQDAETKHVPRKLSTDSNDQDILEQVEKVFKEIEQDEENFISGQDDAVVEMSNADKGDVNDMASTSSRSSKKKAYSTCKREYSKLKTVFLETKIHEKEEIKNLRTLKHGMMQLIQAFNATKKAIADAKSESQNLNSELQNLHDQINFAQDLEKEITEIQHRARINYETGKIELDDSVETGEHDFLSQNSHDNDHKSKIAADELIELLNGNRDSMSQTSSDFLKSKSILLNEVMSSLPEKLTDPALLRIDFILLMDVCILLCAATTGGLIFKLMTRDTSSHQVPSAFELHDDDDDFQGPMKSSIEPPPVIGYLIGGMVVGPSGLGLVHHVRQINTFAQFGCIFLLFRHGLEYNYSFHQPNVDSLAKQQTMTRNKEAATVYVLCTFLITYLVQHFCESQGLVSSQLEAFLVALGVSMSSLTVMLGLLQEKRNMDEKAELGEKASSARFAVENRMLLNYLTFQGIIVGVLFAVPSLVEGTTDEKMMDLMTYLISFLKAGFITGCILFAGWLIAYKLLTCSWSTCAADFYIPKSSSSHQLLHSHSSNQSINLGLVKRKNSNISRLLNGEDTPDSDGGIKHVKGRRVQLSLGKESDEIYLLGTVSFAVVVSLLTEFAGLTIDFGAFFAGMMFGGTPLARKTAKSIQPLSSTFAALMFSDIGMVINPMFIIHNAGAIMSLAFQIIFAKTLIVFIVLAMLRYLQFPGHSDQTSCFSRFEVAMGLGYVGEFSMLFASKLYANGLFQRRLYLLLLSTAIVTMVFSFVFPKIINKFKSTFSLK